MVLRDRSEVRDRALPGRLRLPGACCTLGLQRDLHDRGDEPGRRGRGHRARRAAGEGKQRGQDGRQAQAGHALTIALRRLAVVA